MHEEVLTSSITLIIIGILISQYFSWLIKIPAIIPLMIFGFILGPITGQIHLDTDSNINAFIEIAVAIILFEGGLNLRINEFKEISIGLKRLISLGVVLNWLLGFLAAHYIANLSWEISATISAILVVTGPTVIIPILRHAKLNKRISNFLKWEGIINDPLGVLLVSIIYNIITGTSEDFVLYTVFIGLIKALAISILLATITGWILKKLFEKALFPDYLKVPGILSITILLFIFTNQLQSGSGLLTTTVFGIYFGNQDLHVIDELRKFKESISILAVSFVFIILSASIPLEIFSHLDAAKILFIIALVFLIRPIALFLATIKSEMSIKERYLIGAFGPRGIVAASVAGLIGLELSKKGFNDAQYILPIVFVVILSTVLIHGLSLGPLAKILNLSVKNPNGLIIVGASGWSRKLAMLLTEMEVPVLISDSNWKRLKQSRQEGVKTHYGQVLIDIEIGRIDLSDYSFLLAATGNDSYNALVCSGLSSDFESSNIYQLPFSDHETLRIENLPSDKSGKILSGESFSYDNLKEKYFKGWDFKQTQITEEYSYEEFQQDNKERIDFLIIKADKKLLFLTEENHNDPKAGDTIVSMLDNRDV